MRAHRILPALAATLLLTRAAVAADDPASARAEANALYDAGKYAEAAAKIRQLDDAGQADGTLLYRLFYCQRTAADPASGATLARAHAALEREYGAGRSIETAFYLANVYTNQQRTADTARVSGDVVAGVESGAIPEPSTPFGRFALGKLYADLSRPDGAMRWYGAALEPPAGTAAPLAPAYVRWASRYLADRAFESSDWDAAEQSYTRLADAGEASPDLYDRLAVARARLGLWAEAGDAWRKAERLAPADADRARYCGRIVAQAASLGTLSSTAPDGRLWDALSKAELEDLLTSRAQVVRSAREECQASPGPDEARRAALEQDLAGARATFVAAALEYALDGHNIRETAFVGGFAPLVFHADEWALPPPPEEPPAPSEP